VGPGAKTLSNHSLLSLAATFGTMAAHVHHIEEEMLEYACEMIADESRRVIGTYTFPWPQLAASTQTQRIQLGFPANEPLLRTGHLRDSIEWVVDMGGSFRASNTTDTFSQRGHHGYVGSNDPIAVYQFLGTPSIPARDPILDATMHLMPQIVHHVGQGFHAWLAGGGRTSTELSFGW